MSESILALGKIVDTGEQAEIGRTLFDYIHSTPLSKHLRDRHLLGVLRRHGRSRDESINNIFKARKLHVDGELGAFVLKVADNVVGMATVDAKPSLRRQRLTRRLSLPPKLARGPLCETVPVYGPEITAWINRSVTPKHEQYLSEVYRTLNDRFGPAAQQFRNYSLAHKDTLVEPIQAWTIEPMDSAAWVHHSIQSANFTNDRQDRGYYDDGESRSVSPPFSRLYHGAAPLDQS